MINDKFIERQYNGKALLVTACGFPDVQTRMLLSRLSQECPHLPIYGIADLMISIRMVTALFVCGEGPDTCAE